MALMNEFYYDERPNPGSENWGDIQHNTDSGQISGDSWDVAYDTQNGSGQSDEWFWITENDFSFPPVLLESPNGVLLTSCGKLLLGNKGCVSVGIECQINDGKSDHLRCILLRWEVNAAQSDSFRSALDKLFANAALPAGTITVKARWQSGHWDISKTHSVRFRCMGFVTDWIALPLSGDYVPVLEIKLKNGIIVVNG